MNMIKRISVIIIVLSVIGIASFLYWRAVPKAEDYKADNVYEVNAFEYNRGWGYQISKNGKVIIYQPCIPCIEGDKSFPDKILAENTGNLVLSKIKNHENPSLTIEEVNKILMVNEK